MNSRILHIFTRTPLHVGAGSSVGAVDQPVQRERHTGHPIIPGSSIKGVLRDHFERNGTSKEVVADSFGVGVGDSEGDEKTPECAGKISFSEAKLLAFPLRSARGSYALATCPLALRRYQRDRKLPDIEVPDAPDDMHCLAGKRTIIEARGERGVVLEEYRFAVDGEFPTDWAAELSSLLDDAVLKGAEERFVLLSDGDFSHFALNATQINQHVRIDDETGTADGGGLFNEECVPSETLLYSVLTALSRGAADNVVFEHLAAESVLQFGGDSTTGLGFCTTKLAP